MDTSIVKTRILQRDGEQYVLDDGDDDDAPDFPVPPSPKEGECVPWAVWEDDIPDSFRHNKTAMCGVCWNQTAPYTPISPCCSGPVQAHHSCFQYCPTNLTTMTFGSCAFAYVPHGDMPMMSTCNAAASLPDVPPLGREPSWRAVLGFGHGVGASLVCATLGLFLACLATYFASKSDVVRMRMWACFGVLLCASTVMILYEIQGV